MSWKESRVAVLYGGESDEREVSLWTGEAVASALEGAGYTVQRVDATVEGLRHFVKDLPDVAFVALHGGAGENGSVQGLLESLGVPYTGSGVSASALAMSKTATKQVWAQAGLPTPAWQELSRESVREMLTAEAIEAPIPCVVKPAQGGSTVGVTLVREPEAFVGALERALAAPGPVLLEALVEGRELTVAVMDGQVMGVMEIEPAEGFYDYEAKYIQKTTRYSVPSLPSQDHARVVEVAAAAYRLVGARGVARVDMILDAELQPHLLEINTVPGMTATSLVPKIAAAAGVTFPQLVERILAGARLDSEVWFD